MRASVETTVSCSVVVPTRVIATGVSGLRPASTSEEATSVMQLTAPSNTRVRSSPCWAQFTLASAQFTTATSRCAFVVSGTPAYAGTAVTEDTPGTISNPTPARTQACASSGPEAYTNGSPAISRTTRLPDFACFTTTLARPACVSGWPSRPKPPSTTSAPAQNAATSASCSGASVTTMSAARSSSTARTVSRSGSPGPLPTKDTKPVGSADFTGASATAVADRLRAGEVFLVAVSVAVVSVGVLLTVAF